MSPAEVRTKLAGLVLGGAVGLCAATQMFAWTYGDDPVLGPALRVSPDVAVYPPWSILLWRQRFGEAARVSVARTSPLILLGMVSGLGVASIGSSGARARVRGWGGLKEAREAGLLAGGGAVVGELYGQVLATTDLRPTLVTGGTRSGKGRGHVVPTLLSWGGSVLVHDPKGELWRGTAGWRSGFSHALYFNPRDPVSARWNPLAEIQPGPGELAPIQRLVAILSDPGGTRDDEAIWDKAASEILEAVILHVLYSAADEDKTLLTVRDLLADLDDAAEVMLRTLHCIGVDGEPSVHPFIRTAVKGYAAMHDRFRTSVQGTARSYLKWLAGKDLERVLSASDITMGDLMCARAPVSLYVQVAPADAAALRPLIRLLFYAAAQSLTAHETMDALGATKTHRLLMVMDEFPLLGRLAFFEKSLRLMSGFGIKAMLVAQSLNDIVETYGQFNTILDNCAVYTAFSALDPMTQDKVSRLTGTVLEARESRSSASGFGQGRSSVSRSTTERPLLEPGEIRALPDDQQLVFVAGQRPLRTRKLKYDRRRPFRDRAKLPPPDQAVRIDGPPAKPHLWEGRRSAGQNNDAELPAFKEAKAAMEDRQFTAYLKSVMGRVASEMIAQDAVHIHLQGGLDGKG